MEKPETQDGTRDDWKTVADGLFSVAVTFECDPRGSATLRLYDQWGDF
ncbi:MAG: hypothetical protein K8I30_16515 [Anaerolineae bacterium]|nr:hypothetical protein [Anaerolineae bacterium]